MDREDLGESSTQPTVTKIPGYPEPPAPWLTTSHTLDAELRDQDRVDRRHRLSLAESPQGKKHLRSLHNDYPTVTAWHPVRWLLIGSAKEPRRQVTLLNLCASRQVPIQNWLGAGVYHFPGDHSNSSHYSNGTLALATVPIKDRWALHTFFPWVGNR